MILSIVVGGVSGVAIYSFKTGPVVLAFGLAAHGGRKLLAAPTHQGRSI